MLFCRLLKFSKSTFSKNSFRYTGRVSNSLDSDQARHIVGPDLGPNCLQRLSTDDTSRQRVNLNKCICIYLMSEDICRITINLLSLTLYQLVSSADFLCTQLRPRSGQTFCRTLSESKLFDTLMKFLKEFFEDINFEKNQQTTKQKSIQYFSACKNLIQHFQ